MNAVINIYTCLSLCPCLYCHSRFLPAYQNKFSLILARLHARCQSPLTTCDSLITHLNSWANFRALIFIFSLPSTHAFPSLCSWSPYLSIFSSSPLLKCVSLFLSLTLITPGFILFVLLSPPFCLSTSTLPIPNPSPHSLSFPFSFPPSSYSFLNLPLFPSLSSPFPYPSLRSPPSPSSQSVPQRALPPIPSLPHILAPYPFPLLSLP